ncbi:MAG: TetR/AcrR family transcriptional regulator [Bacilli bacterium]|nr:TetR/AcrR family transcriptional regulator [Bacilli bacterium]
MTQIVKKKIIENKKNKKNKLLSAAFELFTNKGVNNTSIQEIADKAGVGKGTFYLYFKDKYDIQEYLTTEKSRELFESALKNVEGKKINDFKEKLINVIDYVIDELKEDKTTLEFIKKDLSWGVFGERVSSLIDNSKVGVLETFKKGIKESNINIKNPELTLFLIIEMTSSVVFSSITQEKPLPIDKLKPYLYDKIRKILED